LFLALVGEAAQVLELDARHGTRQQLDVANAAHVVGRARGFAAAAHREFLTRVGQFALELLALVEQRATRAGISSTGAFSSAATALTVCTCLLADLRAALPVSASRRRTPAATPESLRLLIRPMSPVRFTCVPPHSSTDQPSALPPRPCHHAHLIAVFLAEQCTRAGGPRIVRAPSAAW